jgi:hypothetical protein
VAKTKKLAPKDVTSRMEALFELLDNALLAPATILKSDGQKQHYETLLMFAFRKRQAAIYHRGRVDDLSNEKQKETNRILAKGKISLGPSVTQMTAKVSKSANEFTYELSAFFAAIRSSIDFLARLLGEHSKAIEVGSITTYLKLIKAGKVGPTLDVVGKHEAWLVHLQDYRDYLIHRLVIGAISGGQREFKNGQWINTIYPIAVPDETPTHVPDTRVFRAMDDPENKFDVRSSELSVTYPGGKAELFERTFELTPQKGYIRIEKLMDRELKAFESFFVDVVDVLINLKFGPATINSKPAIHLS